MGETSTKSFGCIRKWFSNKKNAGIFASIVGIIASELLMAVKVFVFASSSRKYFSFMLDVPLFFISSLFFFLAFHGLKKERETIVLIFIFTQGIMLTFIGICALLFLYILIADPGCESYWTFLYFTYCNFEDRSPGLIFRWTAYGITIYSILSCALYRTIWRGYKFLKMANLRRGIPHVPILAVCNTSYVGENFSTAPGAAEPSTHNESFRHQNQSHGDWPTFFDHQKCVEHERNILRVT